MAIGAPKCAHSGGAKSPAEVGIRPDHQTIVSEGSWRSNWIVCYDDANVECTSGDEVNLRAIDHAQFHWVEIPEGATLAQLRVRVATSATTFDTNNCVGEIWCLDSNGVPQRIDSDDSDDATQITLTLNDNAFQGVDIDGAGAATEDGSDGYYYGDVSKPSGEQGYDLQGNTWFGFPVVTASDVTDGASDVAVEVLVKFLNA